MWKYLIDKIYLVYSKLFDIALICLVVLYVIRDYLLEMLSKFKENKTKFYIIYGNIISLFVLSLYAKTEDISTLYKAIFLMSFYFLVNNLLFYDISNADYIIQLHYMIFITLAPILSHFIKVKEVLYKDIGGILLESLSFAFFNIVASMMLSGAFIIVLSFIEIDIYPLLKEKLKSEV